MAIFRDRHRYVDGHLVEMRGGKLHCDTGPARISEDGTREWWFDGVRHCALGGPAIEYANGDREWWTHGVCTHIERVNGICEYFDHGKVTRRKWQKHGVLHRDGDLPAVEYANGDCEWWFKNARHRDGDKPAVVHVNGTREWWFTDARHRDDDKPAIVCADGTREWWVDGVRHRIDNPAVIDTQSAQLHVEWWYRGTRHHANGPAIICDRENCEICRSIARCYCEDEGCQSINWWYQGQHFDSREDYLRANPWWHLTAHQLALGRADPKCVLSFLDKDTVHMIALACFARD